MQDHRTASSPASQRNGSSIPGSAPAPVDAGRTGRALSPVTRARLLVFGGTFVVALVMAFVVWRAQDVVEQTNDLYRFADIAKNILAGNGFRYTGGPLTIRRGPGYPFFIAFLYAIFGAHQIAIQLAQCLLAAGTATLAFETARRVFSERAGWIAAVLVALHPMVMRYVPDIQVEELLIFLYMLTVYRSVRLLEDETWLNGLWAGLAVGAAAMVKAVALPYAALFMLAYLGWRRAREGSWSGAARALVPIAAMGCGMAIVILPWTYRNYEVTGRFVLVSGNASGEFLRGYVFAQDRYYLLRDKPYEVGENEANNMQRELFAKKGLVWERDETETEKVQNEAAREKLRSDPGAFVRKFFIGLAMFWYVVTTRLNSLVVGALALGGWACAVVAWVRGHPRKEMFLFVLLPIVTLNLTYAAVLALGRYSAPCIPLLMVLASGGIAWIFERRGASPAPLIGAP
jgi:4-amino-4-deoxy-L-arabinose transferase-like glycosyltransferase